MQFDRRVAEDRPRGDSRIDPTRFWTTIYNLLSFLGESMRLTPPQKKSDNLCFLVMTKLYLRSRRGGTCVEVFTFRKIWQNLSLEGLLRLWERLPLIYGRMLAVLWSVGCTRLVQLYRNILKELATKIITCKLDHWMASLQRQKQSYHLKFTLKHN